MAANATQLRGTAGGCQRVARADPHAACIAGLTQPAPRPARRAFGKPDEHPGPSPQEANSL